VLTAETSQQRLRQVSPALVTTLAHLAVTGRTQPSEHRKLKHFTQALASKHARPTSIDLSITSSLFDKGVSTCTLPRRVFRCTYNVTLTANSIHSSFISYGTVAILLRINVTGSAGNYRHYLF